jgi:hypothetical protein
MNTADDPTTLSSLPPRHALESDSEEDDDPAFPLPHSSRQRSKPSPVELRVSGWQGERDSCTLVVVGGEAAGKFADGYDGQAAGEIVRVDGDKEEIVRRPRIDGGWRCRPLADPATVL